MDTPLNSVEELVLDGQQRLTSLLQALSEQSERRFFIEVSDFSMDTLEIEEVFCEQERNARKLDEPAIAYRKKCIPMYVLRGEKDERGLTPLARWCVAVSEEVGAELARVLESKVEEFVNEHFFEREIWYCSLPASTDRPTATQIFVETNTSSVKIKEFDIQVATARGVHDEDVRNSIHEEYGRPGNNVLRHYFKEDPEEWIPDIGEWMLKIACLRAGHAPRETNYKAALESLFVSGGDGSFSKIEKLFSDLAWTLDCVGELGAATRRTVPSWPPLHVLAALRPTFESITDPSKINSARKLLAAYYWRCLFSNRHDVQANDRLHSDFKALDKALEEICESGVWNVNQPVFDVNDHPVYSKQDLLRHAPWIGSASRLGRALASAVMSTSPPDWITGEPLNAKTIRRLERSGDLDRHHVFPRNVLKNNREPTHRIQNGLNGVLLDGKTNRRLANLPPDRYLAKVLRKPNITEATLRSRIEKHLVPYDQINNTTPIQSRYDVFLKRRAKLLADKIKTLGALP